MPHAIVLASLLIFVTSPAVAGAALVPGDYEVAIKLELPHIEAAGVSKSDRICVTANEAGAFGLAVLSENNPLSKCPVANVRHLSGELQFDIICQGDNAAIGWARFALQGDRFEGTIAMKMGGKNMTMTERQTGRRVGDCNSIRP